MEDKELRQEYHHQIVKCVDKAGMIGEGGDMCCDEGCDEGCEEEPDDLESTASNPMDQQSPRGMEPKLNENDEWDYSPDEIADFLSNLSFPLNVGSDDDWDEIFSPLDGTAHFAFCEKMNHSCNPNCVILYKSRGWGRFHPLVAYCIALKDIEPDEELTIAYIQTDESYESRQKALANYGFECSCPRCLREKAPERGRQDEPCVVCDEKLEAHEKLGDEDLFGSDDDDESSGSNELDVETGSESKPLDGDTKLKNTAEKIESIWNKSNQATIPPRYLAVVTNYVTQMVSALNEHPGALQVEENGTTLKLLQQCRNGMYERDFSLCRIVGPGLEHHLYRTLEVKGRFQSPQFREAYWCACCTSAIGLAQEGSFLLALRSLDKAMVLGLKRASIGDFLSYVELFASQMNATPCRHAIECIIPDFMDGGDHSSHLEQSVTIRFPVAEMSFSTSHLGTIIKEQSKPVLLRGLAATWPALSRWRNMEAFSHSHGHRLVPVEVGSMKSGMKEQLMSLREFVSKFLAESAKKPHWSLNDATDSRSKIAYLAQHPLLEQIPELWEDVERNPCGLEPSNVNAWIGTGGTRTPLHFDSYDNLLIQLVGSKYVRLYHPKETHKLYVSKDEGYGLQGNMSELDCEIEDYNKHALAKDVEFTEVLLQPGDCLYIPSRHWHYVRSLNTSASINYWF
jgi:lysine-specific demethylase 8